jgi:hypothetical protein
MQWRKLLPNSGSVIGRASGIHGVDGSVCWAHTEYCPYSWGSILTHKLLPQMSWLPLYWKIMSSICNCHLPYIMHTIYFLFALIRVGHISILPRCPYQWCMIKQTFLTDISLTHKGSLPRQCNFAASVTAQRKKLYVHNVQSQEVMKVTILIITQSS